MVPLRVGTQCGEMRQPALDSCLIGKMFLIDFADFSMFVCTCMEQKLSKNHAEERRPQRSQGRGWRCHAGQPQPLLHQGHLVFSVATSSFQHQRQLCTVCPYGLPL